MSQFQPQASTPGQTPGIWCMMSPGGPDIQQLIVSWPPVHLQTAVIQTCLVTSCFHLRRRFKDCHFGIRRAFIDHKRLCSAGVTFFVTCFMQFYWAEKVVLRPMQTDPTLLGPTMLWLVASVCMEPQQCWHLLALVAYSLKPVKLLGPCKRTQHCWPTTPNNVGSCWHLLRPFAWAFN